MILKPSRLSYKSLEKKLWRIFSEFIRRRDIFASGMCKCITCGKVLPWKEMHCGHYIPRTKKPTKYNQRNNHAQCFRCNYVGEGEKEKYAIAIDEKYGPGTAEALRLLSKQTVRRDRATLMVLIQEYENKLEELDDRR